MRRIRSESGAAAVEFALVVPALLLVLFGIVEFGKIYNTQLQVTSAAREAVRVMAIQKDPDVAVAAAILSAPGLQPALSPSQVSVSSCDSATETTVIVTYSVSLVSGLFANSVSLTGKGVMRCGG